jgi:ornithine cyclodeaminase/alanine dehydrogenase
MRVMGTLLLTQSQVAEVADMAMVVAAVEEAFAAHGRGQVLMPAKVYLELDEYNGDFRAMPAYMSGAAGVKWVNSHPDNPSKAGLPAVMGVYILSDPESALPLAIMDATLLTALRTGAAAAVASKYLAVGRPRTLGLVGAGVQAGVLLDAHRELYGDLQAKVADRQPDCARSFADERGGHVVSVEEACAADIVCTSTPSRAPVVMREWVGSGTHINAMGADGPGKQELDPELLAVATVVIDEPHQALHSGEINVPIAAGTFVKDDIHGTLGEVVVGRCAGRRGEEISVFDSTGLAIQDVAVARVVYERARERGVGTEVDLRS